MENKISEYLFLDKELKNGVSFEQVKLWNKAIHNGCRANYFYDGNNGDKHLFVGYAEFDNSVQVLGINLTQCHLFGASYKPQASANKAAESLFNAVEQNVGGDRKFVVGGYLMNLGNVLVHTLNKVMLYEL